MNKVGNVKFFEKRVKAFKMIYKKFLLEIH